MSQGLLVLQSSEKKRIDRQKRWGDNITEWKEWTLPAQPGQLKIGLDGTGLLRSLLLYPDDFARFWARRKIE